MALTLRRLRQPTRRSTLQNMIRHQTTPSSLMTRPKAPPIIPMEELIEPDIVPEVRVKVQLVVPSVRRAPVLAVPREDMYDAVLDLLRHAEEVHELARACGALDLDVVAVVLIKPLQALDEQEVHRQPYTSINITSLARHEKKERTDRPTPVRVPAKHARVRVARPVIDLVPLSMNIHPPRLILMPLG